MPPLPASSRDARGVAAAAYVGGCVTSFATSYVADVARDSIGGDAGEAAGEVIEAVGAVADLGGQVRRSTSSPLAFSHAPASIAMFT